MDYDPLTHVDLKSQAQAVKIFKEQCETSAKVVVFYGSGLGKSHITNLHFDKSSAWAVIHINSKDLPKRVMTDVLNYVKNKRVLLVFPGDEQVNFPTSFPHHVFQLQFIKPKQSLDSTEMEIGDCSDSEQD